MKKTIAIFAVICLITGAFILTSCSAKKPAEETGETAQAEKLSIVTTIFPEYDWVRQIMGDKADNAEITMLLDSGVDLHSYQPTAADIMKLSNCDLFIYVGGESDGWAEDALANRTNKDMTVINLLETLGDSVKEEETVEGMEHEEEHEHEKDHGHEEEHEEAEMDEHVWLSLRNTQVLVDEIAAKLGEADPANKQTYLSNAAAYNKQLADLDSQYKAAVDTASTKTLLFGDRFPFRYLVDDYGLEYYAAFSGCSAESEASFETVSFLSAKIDELGLKNVMVIDNSDRKLANTIIENTASKDATVLVLNSMQSTTSRDVGNGASYLSIMQSNLEVLKQALA
ncbi:MAG: metal ABC transporter substrate-binding protein [Clostridia bacterium]|nr:metal ABC transporter substrate-binding protein [Clostridia bacterium]